MNSYDSRSYARFTEKAEIDKSVHELEGLLQGILLDGAVNDAQVDGLKLWSNFHTTYEHKHPFSELLPIVRNVTGPENVVSEDIHELLWLCERFCSTEHYYSAITADLQRLDGILDGVLIAGEISIVELRNLEHWLDENSQLSSCYPYDEINSIAISILKNGTISSEDQELLRSYFSNFVDIRTLPEAVRKEIISLKDARTVEGICSVDPQIVFARKSFCFTGRSSKYSRDEFMDMVAKRQGIPSLSVTHDLDYLVVGNGGNPSWAYACYGRKVEQAVSLRKAGKKVLIVNETDFLDAMG